MSDYANVDSIFDDVEKAMLRVACEENLLRLRIERWRWDLPVITMSWVGDDGLSRNVHAFVNNKSNAIEIEANVWKDLQNEGQRLRQWNHKICDWVDLQVVRTSPREKITKAIYGAYRTASEWTERNLSNRKLLPSESMSASAR